MFIDRIPVRLRLSLGHAIWMALVFSSIGFGLFQLVEHNLYKSIDAGLLTAAKSIRDSRTFKGINPPAMENFLETFFGERFIRPYAQLINLSGQISAKTPNVAISLPVTPKAVSRAEQGLETFEIFKRKNQPPLRQITLPVMAGNRFTGELIQIGAPLDTTEHALSQISMVLWFALPSGLLLSIVFGYLLTKSALKPVVDIQKAASSLSSQDLGVRLPLPKASDELKELALTFNAMLDRLEDAFKRLRRFTGDVSHELRTPLTVLRGEAELALRKKRSPEDYEEALRTIAKESNNMTGIIEDLLLLARAESKSVALNLVEVGPEQFIKDVATSVGAIYEQRNIELKVTNVLNKPFIASPNYLALALKNILLNAAKHSAPGSRVEIRVKEEGGASVFEVKDFGEGIPEASLPYIFDTFYRADTARNRASGGTGIGLSLAMALVKLHGGKLMANSKQGEGATFTISLPFEKSPVAVT